MKKKTKSAQKLSKPIKLKRKCLTDVIYLSPESACQTGIRPVLGQHASSWQQNQRTA